MRQILLLPIVGLLFFLIYTIFSSDTNVNEVQEYNNKILLYAKTKCEFCTKAKRLFKQKNLPYIEIDITWDRDLQTKLITQTNQHTVPYIFMDGKFIGGYTDLVKFYQSKK